MTARRRSWQRRLVAYYERRPAALDVTLILIVTAIGGALRLARLGDIPYGVHPDEAQIGLDAIRVIHHGWIGVYSHAALGVPTLNSYVDAPGVWLLGRTAFSLRLPLALVGLAAVPLLYLVVRVSCGRAEAFFSSLLLATSYWHIFYSRVAHSSISYPTVTLAAALCIMLGLKTERRAWFIIGGVLLGIGIYAYNVDAIVIVAFAAFLGILTLMRMRRREELRTWWPKLGLCFGAALIVSLPFIDYIADPHAYYWEHIDNYRDTGLMRTREYRDADAPGKVKIIAGQLRDFAATYTWDGQEDIVDASGLRPMFDPMMLALPAIGVLMAVQRRREPVVILALCCMLIVLLPALLQKGSMMREPLGAAPFVMFIAALPLAAIWRAAMRADVRTRIAGAAAVGAPIAIIAALAVHDYFWTWRNAGLTRYVYHQEITSASLYMETRPRDEYVYFYSERHPLSLETRQYLAPDVRGEDRSAEFSDLDGSIDDIDRSRRVAFVLLNGPYIDLLAEIEQQYPGGVERAVTHDGKLDFKAYELPAGGGQ